MTATRPDVRLDAPFGDGERTSAPPRSRSTRKRLVYAGAAVLLALFAIWVVAFSSVFGVRSVDVKGTSRLSVAAVLRAADVPSGTALLRLDTAAIAHRVEQLPEISSATVTTSFPSTVVISVTERTPVGVVARGHRFALVDATGAPFTTVAHRPTGLPRLILPRGTAGAPTARAIAQVAAQLPGDIRVQLRSMQALDGSSITLVMRDGRIVRWGSAARSAEKAKLLAVLLRQRSHAIDLTDPDQPFTR